MDRQLRQGTLAAGLTLLNLSLDTLRPARFEAMTRRPGLQRVLDTLHHALHLGFDPIKVSLLPRRHLSEQMTALKWDAGDLPCQQQGLPADCSWSRCAQQLLQQVCGSR